MRKQRANDPWYVAERNVERALDRAAAGQPVATVAGSTLVIEPTERVFSTVAEIDEHLEWLACQPPVARLADNSGSPAVVLDARRRHAIHQPTGSDEGRSDRGSVCGTIRLPDTPFGRRQMTVLHEYAHHLTVGDGHGPRFCGVLVVLVGTAIGPAAALMLTEQFGLHEVDVLLL